MLKNFTIFVGFFCLVQLVQFHQTRRFLYLSWVWCRWCSSKKTKYSTDTEDFLISVEFGAVGAVGAVQVQFKKAKILNWRRRFPYLSWVWCSWCSRCSKILNLIKFIFEFLKIWNWHNFCQNLFIIKILSHTRYFIMWCVFFA